MYQVLLCHRRHHNINNETFHTQWSEERKRLVLELKQKLGYTHYAQLHQFSRCNILYKAIRLSRSWPFTAFFSLIQGLAVPPLFYDRKTAREERWDLVESFSYPSQETLCQALTSLEGADAGEKLKTNSADYVRRTAVITAEEFIVNEDPSLQGKPRIVTVFCLRARPELTREKMLEHWGSSHKQLVMSKQSSLKYREYSQLHCRNSAELSDVVKNLGGSAGEEFDGVAVLAYGSQWELIRGLVNPMTQIANFRLVKDEATFIDGSRSALVFGREPFIENE